MISPTDSSQGALSFTRSGTGPGVVFSSHGILNFFRSFMASSPSALDDGGAGAPGTVQAARTDFVWKAAAVSAGLPPRGS